MTYTFTLVCLFLAAWKLGELLGWSCYRFRLWRLDRQRCEICNRRGARQFEINGRDIRLCKSCLMETMRFNIEDIVRRAHEMERDSKGEEWKQ